MADRIADGKGLGWGAAGVLFIAYGLAYTPWFPASVLNSSFGHSATLFAAIALLLAAGASFLRGERLHAAFFGFLSALTWAAPTLMDAVWADPAAYEGVEGSLAFNGWVLLGYALFNLMVGIGGWRSEEVGTPGAAAMMSVGVLFTVNAAAHWGAPSVLFLGVALFGSAAAAASFWAAGRALVGGEIGAG